MALDNAPYHGSFFVIIHCLLSLKKLKAISEAQCILKNENLQKQPSISRLE
jgi:hypothetical protein